MTQAPRTADHARHETTGGPARQVVWSPEQVALHLQVAGPASRMLAYGIDALIILLLEIGALVLLLASTPLLGWIQAGLREVADDLAKGNSMGGLGGPHMLMLFGLFLLIQFVIEWGYFVFWELVSGGRSLGKLCLKLRVVRDGGWPIGARESLIRNLLRMVDLLPGPYVVGLVAMIASPDGKRLGDVAAGTIVIRLDRPEPAPPLLDEVPAPAAQGFRFERTQLARIGPTERTLLHQTLRRVERLPPAQADAIVARAAGALCARLGHPPVPPPQDRAFLLALLDATRRQ